MWHFAKEECSSHATPPASFTTCNNQRIFLGHILCNSHNCWFFTQYWLFSEETDTYKLIKPLSTPCYLLPNYAEAVSPVPDYCSVRGNSCSILVYFAQQMLQDENVLVLFCVNWKKQVILSRHVGLFNPCL